MWLQIAKNIYYMYPAAEANRIPSDESWLIMVIIHVAQISQDELNNDRQAGERTPRSFYACCHVRYHTCVRHCDFV